MSHLQWQDVSCLRPCDTQISGKVLHARKQDVAQNCGKLSRWTRQDVHQMNGRVSLNGLVSKT